MIYFITVLAYLVGSIPFGFIIAWLVGAGDIRGQGSGNIGATNVMRSVGKLPGLMTFLLDFLKGTLVVVLAHHFAGDTAAVCAAVAAVVGHSYPIFLKFKGGKSVAVGAGVFMAISPKAVLAVLLIFALVALTTRIVSAASLTASAAFPPIAWLLGSPIPAVWAGVLVVVVIFIRHGANIRRLIRGEEPTFRLKKDR
ncbi:MAG: glycerol-3-phosphate 1-O-acyltransferase PlsY [Acidobacteriota bacterium]